MNTDAVRPNIRRNISMVSKLLNTAKPKQRPTAYKIKKREDEHINYKHNEDANLFDLIA